MNLGPTRSDLGAYNKKLLDSCNKNQTFSTLEMPCCELKNKTRDQNGKSLKGTLKTQQTRILSIKMFVFKLTLISYFIKVLFIKKIFEEAITLLT